jgi:hypothetical protein
MGLTWVLDLFALMGRTFPGYGLSHLSGVDFRATAALTTA